MSFANNQTPDSISASAELIAAHIRALLWTVPIPETARDESAAILAANVAEIRELNKSFSQGECEKPKLYATPDEFIAPEKFDNATLRLAIALNVINELTDFAYTYTHAVWSEVDDGELGLHSFLQQLSAASGIKYTKLINDFCRSSKARTLGTQLKASTPQALAKQEKRGFTDHASRAREVVAFHQEHGRYPSLMSTDTTEKTLGSWLSHARRAKRFDSPRGTMREAWKILDDHMGREWASPAKSAPTPGQAEMKARMAKLARQRDELNEAISATGLEARNTYHMTWREIAEGLGYATPRPNTQTLPDELREKLGQNLLTGGAKEGK